jgi:hypothetical protein
MGRKIQFRRGTEADRKQTVLANGEPGWSPDEKQLFIGNGVDKGGTPAMMAHFKIINTPSTAVLGGRHLFTAITTLQLEDNPPEGTALTVLLDESVNATKDNPVKILAPIGKTIGKGNDAGTEYQMFKSGIERTLIFRNGGWAL